ncbi:MAG: AAA family ATPase [Erythrobacter sp.]|uniref:AAA family ATPase n=1 Tax=Erythrobacter sp. TaxID=1042 RepID=UPI001B0022E1|nr:AAA family ATPase [Erythrobacter sp.]MBO6768033.1 AAA family ATPase [Erythrobacter sp.]
MTKFVVLSGCSGGGKTALGAELARRGYRTIAEPGLRIVREERARGGEALPWIDEERFARRALAMARADLDAASAGQENSVFFDRGLVDAAAALDHATGHHRAERYEGHELLCRQVFFVPPWEKHFHQSADRRHSFANACAEYERLLEAYRILGFTPFILPHESVEARADRLLAALDLLDHR